MATPTLTDALQETLALFDDRGTPLTTSEAADRLDVGRRSTYERLERLVDHGHLETKKVGARGRIWWRSVTLPDDREDTIGRLSRLVDNLPGMVYRCRNEPGWPMSFVSDAAADLTGYDPEAIESDEVSWGEDVVHPDDRRQLWDDVNEQLEDGGRFTVEYRIRTADGETRWVRERGCAVDGDGERAGELEGVITDVSERERSELARAEREQQFRSLVEATEEYAIFMLDREGRVVTWNSGARKIKGYEEDEIVGEHFSTFYTEEDLADGLPERNLATALERGAVEDEGWRLREDGSRFWANVTITAIYDEEGEHWGFAKVTRDMTERRERELALRRERDLVERVLETSPVGIGVLSRDGLERINARAAHIYGSDTDGVDDYVIGEPRVFDEDGELVPPEERPNARVFETGESVYDWECQLEGVDGNRRWLSVSAAPIREDGEVERVVVATEDITNLKEHARQLEREHEEIESELNDVFERVDDAFYALDDEFRFIYVNERAEELLRASQEELLGKSVWDMYPDARESPAWGAFHEALETLEPKEYDVYFEPLEFWVEAHVYPSESGLSVYFRDVTERKKRERELERFETIVETIEDGVYVLDENYHFVQVNDAYVEMTGYDRDELVGTHCSLVLGEDTSLDAAELSRAMAAGDGDSTTIEADILRADGDRLPAESKFSPMPSPNGEFRGTVGVVRDISELRKRESRLRRYETLVSSVPDAVYMLEPDGTIDLVNYDALKDLTGLDRSDLEGRSFTSLLDDEDVERARDGIREILSSTSDTESVTQELTISGTHGEEIPCEHHMSVLLGDDGELEAVVGTIRDVTDRKERERELERYAQIVETVDDGIYVVDTDGRFTMVNEAYAEMTGYSREELVGMSVRSIVEPETAEQARTYEREMLAGERESARLEADVRTADGDAFPAEATFSLLQSDDSIERIGVVRDVTERNERERELEARISQQEVVAELGREALEDRDLDELMADAAERVAETLDNDYCKVLDLDAEAEKLLLRQGVGWKDGIVGSATVSAVEADSQAAYTLQNRDPIVVEDLTTESRFRGPALLTDHDVRSGVSTIIGNPDEPWGILGTHDRAVKRFSEHDVRFVQTVANIIATAIERHEHERQLVAQRERLAALNDINDVVRSISGAAIDQSTREEIETVVCEELAATTSYRFAWVGDVDAQTQTIRLRTEAGVEGYLDDTEISVDPDEESGIGPTGRAVQTHEMQVTNDVMVDESYRIWRERARELGFRSSAAIPIVYEDVLYGVLNVYADRPNAFSGDEHDVMRHLGEVVGHAIASVERKRALTSDEVVEIEFRIADALDVFDLPGTEEGRVVLERSIPVGDDDYLVYGTVTEDMVGVFDALAETLPHWKEARFLGEETDEGERRFELRLVDPPVLSTVTALGGYVDQARIQGGDYHMRVHLAPSVDVRRLIDLVKEEYPMAQLVSRQQITRSTDSPKRLSSVLAEHLTDRQRSALESAYFSGYFEWPRDVSGEDVADSLGVSAPTFHQHLRIAQRKFLEIAFDDGATA